MPSASITVHLQQPIATIQPQLHGQFIEHLGTCIYDGIWVGEQSTTPNINGIRRDVVEALQQIRPPVIRWPGGCFADGYHWMDGIGPRDQRPVRVANRWGADELESNAFGTHEFLDLCRLVGADPWINGNMGGGTPRELGEWVEYCNYAGTTTITQRRVANGTAEPFGVRYWGIGNESWDCGGKFRPDSYADEYKRFESHFPRFHNQAPFLIACGPDGNKPHETTAWTQGFFQRLREWRWPRIDGYDAHFYTWNMRWEGRPVRLEAIAGTATEYTVDQWYQLLAASLEIEKLILHQRALLDEVDPDRAIGLVIGEWGAWHLPTHGQPPLWQQSALRDGLIAALTLDVFHRHADKVVMATLAQTVNVLHALILTDGERMVLTPSYHVFDLYQGHRGGQSVHVDFAAEGISFAAPDRSRSLPMLQGSASIKDDTLTLSVVNLHSDTAVDAEITIDGGAAEEIAMAWLSHHDLRAHNTFDQPTTLVPQRDTLPVPHPGPWRHTFPPASVSVFTVRLAGNEDHRSRADGAREA
jgi:alpha-N-arabinofuranosidase